MPRRANHEGNITRRADGRWEARIWVGGRRVSKYGRTRAEVVAKLAQLHGTVAVLSSTVPLLLAEWVERWLAERDLRPSSDATYRKTLRPILADLGHVKLDKLTPMMLQLQFTLLRERGMGARRRQLAHGYLKGCLKRAVNLGLLGTNPMDAVSRPQWIAKKKDYWTQEEAERFLDAAARSTLRYAPLYLLVVSTGLRTSEVLGLEAEDVDLGRAAVTVNRAWVWEEKEPHRGYNLEDAKSLASNRSITVPAVAEAALELIPFRTKTGQVPLPAMLRRTLALLCQEACVPLLTPHGLRHVHAALAYRATGDAYAVQRRLGHSSVTTTMGMYGFGLRHDDETREALDRLFGPTPASG